jgi:hypothetical protein
MGRTMTTYPVSEPEMDQISSLNDQFTVRAMVSSSLLALAAGIWTNALFANDMTPSGHLASLFAAPLLLVFALGYGYGAYVARKNRVSAWTRIKSEATPIHTEAAAASMMVSASRPPSRRGGR